MHRTIEISVKTVFSTPASKAVIILTQKIEKNQKKIENLCKLKIFGANLSAYAHQGIMEKLRNGVNDVQATPGHFGDHLGTRGSL